MFEFQISVRGMFDIATAPVYDIIISLLNVALPISTSLSYHSHIMLINKSFVELNQWDISVILQTKDTLRHTQVWQRWSTNEKFNITARIIHAINPF